ncbi:MAG: pilus assembly protein PilP [Gammaproteobacteria bacterium]
MKPAKRRFPAAWPALGATLAAFVLLAGCSGNNMQDLHGWVAQVRARPGTKIESIPKMTSYHSYSYPSGLRGPFEPMSAPKVGSIHPNSNRKKQYLEQFPLDALKFVGEITFGGTTYALIKDPDGVVHRVHDGDYLGQNNGEITAIGPATIQLTEIVPDGSGSYLRQPASLSLAQQNGG